MSKAAVAGVRDGLKTAGTTAIALVLTALYIGVATVSTTHEQLLLGRDLKLVPLAADVPLLYFFSAASYVFVALHIVLLLQLKALHSKLLDVCRDWRARQEFSTSLLGQALVGAGARSSPGFLQGLLIVLILVLPHSLLAVIQIEFLPYHARSLAFWSHQVPFLLDLGACVYLVPRIFRGGAEPSDSGGERVETGPHKAAAIHGGLVLWCILGGFFCRSVAVVQWSESGDRGVLVRRMVDYDLDLADRVLVEKDRASALLEVFRGGGRPRSLDLAARDLRGADFSRAVLVGADFRGADLAGAHFVDADLRGADFSSLPASDRRVETRTNLGGVDFSGADLREARFSRAILRDADLERADLRGAELARVDLRLADLRDTRLQGSVLSYALLRGSRLGGADLTCADLYAVVAEGLWAVEAVGVGVDLRRAELQGARFVGAVLPGSDFSGAKTVGGDFRSAEIGLSRGLALMGLDLRHADLTGAWVSGWGEDAPRVTDARGVGFSLPCEEFEERIAGALKVARAGLAEHRIVNRRLTACERRLRERLDEMSGTDAAPGKPMGPTSPSPQAMQPAEQQLIANGWQDVLLDPPLANKVDWKVPPLSPRSFRRRSAVALIGAGPSEGCRSVPFAAALALRAWGCSAPRDPDLEVHLRRRIRGLLDSPGACPALNALADVLEANSSEKETSGVKWPQREGFPRWPVPAVDCADLHRALWRVASR